MKQGPGIFQIFGQLRQRMQERRRSERGRAELNSMGERELSDLAIGRSEIPACFSKSDGQNGDDRS